MAERTPSPPAAPRTYAELRRSVEAVVFAGRRRIEDAWLRTYHDTGRLIQEHLLANQERADYGARVFHRLAADTGISKRVLYECVQLYRCFPIVRTSAPLTRSHYQLLCQISDPPGREALAAQAIKRRWTVAELAVRVRASNAALALQDRSSAGDPAVTDRDVALLKPKRGTPGLHLVVERGDGLAVDLGFKLYRRLAPGSKLPAGAIVRFAADGSLRAVGDATKADLFAYEATLRRSVDGDTFVVALEVAPEIFVEEKLRLRGLDCPELATPEGKAAKRFADALLAQTRSVVINTTKPDKYDRYLADVFLIGAPGPSAVSSAGASAKAEGSPKADPLADAPVFLNNALLEAGHAVRKDAWEFGDWGVG